MSRKFVERTCRHCGTRTVSRPRGLCSSCYYRREIREQYAVVAQAYDTDRHNQHRHVLGTPTRALPGTPEKVAVLMERARLGQALWHLQDYSEDSR